MRMLAAVLALACVSAQAEGPVFKVDAAWPQPLPEENGVQLILGQVAGVAVDERNGHVWIIHRPSTLLPDEWKDGKAVTHRCCKSAPPPLKTRL